jgi:hypothetical protein
MFGNNKETLSKPAEVQEKLNGRVQENSKSIVETPVRSKTSKVIAADPSTGPPHAPPRAVVTVVEFLFTFENMGLPHNWYVCCGLEPLLEERGVAQFQRQVKVQRQYKVAIYLVT